MKPFHTPGAMRMTARFAIQTKVWRATDGILEDVSHRSTEDMHLDGLPSWVPRWHRPWDSGTDARRLNFFDSKPLEGDVSLAEPVSNGLATWLVKALTIDTVHVVAPRSGDWDWEVFDKQYLRPLYQFLSDTESFEEITCRVLTANTWSNLQALDSQAVNSLRRWLRGGQLMPDVQESCREAVLNACGGRAVSMTMEGLPALVPHITIPGDLVVWILGSSTPTVLRPSGSRYEVVGQAYVHGIMDGRPILEQSSARTPAASYQSFCLI